MWHVLRRPWALTSGGAADDGLYRSTDGGRTWSQVTGNGFPSPPIGRIGLAIAPSQPSAHLRARRIGRRRALALRRLRRYVEAGEQGFPGQSAPVLLLPRARLADRCRHRLRREHAARNLVQRRREVQPLGVRRPSRPARHVDLVRRQPHGAGRRRRHRDLDQRRLRPGRTRATSRSARSIASGFPTRSPYLVCGGLQDNNAYCGPSFNGNLDGITNRDWFKVTEGDGEWADSRSGESAPDLGGFGERRDRRLRSRLARIHERASVSRRPRKKISCWRKRAIVSTGNRRSRLPPTIRTSPSSAANVLFQTSDGGKHWKAISPDLTRNDKSKQQVSKDSVTHDESGAENYGTILDIETSARRNGEIWTGSDDGLVYLTRDGGAHWRNVTPPGLARRQRRRNRRALDAAPTARRTSRPTGTRWATTRPTSSSRTITARIGRSVTNGIPAGEYVRAVRPDSANREHRLRRHESRHPTSRATAARTGRVFKTTCRPSKCATSASSRSSTTSLSRRTVARSG